MQSYISKIDDIKLSDLKWADGKEQMVRMKLVKYTNRVK